MFHARFLNELLERFEGRISVKFRPFFSAFHVTTYIMLYEHLKSMRGGGGLKARTAMAFYPFRPPIWGLKPGGP